MQNQLSQKEKMFLQDLKSEEELCVTKYKEYAQQAQDSQLSQLFNKLASEEQKHYDSINQMLQGNMSGQSQGQQKQSSSQAGQSGQSAGGSMNVPKVLSAELNGQGSQNASGSNSDKTLLHEMLSLEKYVSGAYDTSIFESAQPAVRQTLQGIQKDEQSHGEQIFQYMSSHGMYQVQ